MPSTFEALALVVIALLPGGLYTWAFEQHAGRWGANTADRLQRLMGASAVLLVVQLPLFYYLYQHVDVGSAVIGKKDLPWWFWLVPIGYVAVPIVAGKIIGASTRARRRWTKVVTGPSPAPRAWDHLFSMPNASAWLLIQLNSGDWLGGVWGTGGNGIVSYAAGYPDEQDLLIADLAEVTDDGRFVLDDNGSAILTGMSLLVRWSEIRCLKYMPSREDKEK